MNLSSIEMNVIYKHLVELKYVINIIEQLFTDDKP